MCTQQKESSLEKYRKKRLRMKKKSLGKEFELTRTVTGTGSQPWRLDGPGARGKVLMAARQ